MKSGGLAAGQVVMHGVVQQPFFRGLEFGDVGERAHEPHHFAVVATTGRALIASQM